MKKLKIEFEDLLNLQEVYQRLKEGKGVRLTPNQKTLRMLETAVKLVRSHIKKTRGAVKSNIEFRKPKLKSTAEEIARRQKREDDSRDFYRELDLYLKDYE